jgi:cytochrome c oxidase subunit 1
MYATGAVLLPFFSLTTFLIAVPTGIKFVNWIGTMWRGRITFETPMLFACGFLFLFTLGGFTGLVLAIVPVDIQLQDTYYVVAHFHYVMVAGALFSAFAAVYFWIPKWTGTMYNEKLGKIHFWLTMIGFNLTFFVQHFLGLAGMPRRIPDYNLQFADFNMVSSLGSFLMGGSQLLFVYIVWQCYRGNGEKSSANPWDGAEGLEWTLPSPPPYHTFENPPEVK